MARYIFVNSTTGRIAGDTADLTAHPHYDDHVEMQRLHPPRGNERYLDAVQWLEEALTGGSYGRRYEIVRAFAPGESGYYVYRVDTSGPAADLELWAGYDQKTIDSVRAPCKLVAIVRCTRRL